jgi:hypothetical protein
MSREVLVRKNRAINVREVREQLSRNAPRVFEIIGSFLDEDFEQRTDLSPAYADQGGFRGDVHLDGEAAADLRELWSGFECDDESG